MVHLLGAGLPTQSGGFLWPKPVDCKVLAVMVRSFFYLQEVMLLCGTDF